MAYPLAHIGGTITDILVAFAIMTLPMILLSALLLGLVYHYRIVQHAFESQNLAFDSGQDDSNVFYAKISATTLSAIASCPIEVLSNVSTVMIVRTHTVGKLQFACLGSAQLSRLASIDYTAYTYGVNSQCTPVTTDCKMGYELDGAGSGYDCPFEFAGTADTSAGDANSLAMAYFAASSGQNNDTDRGSIGNPYSYAAVAVVNTKNPPSPALMKDPQVSFGIHEATIIAVWCNATVYDLEYTAVNGTITRFITKPSNSRVTGILQATQRRTEAGDANLVQAVSVAGLGNTAQSISDQFAQSDSETALAVASGAFGPRPATELQLRSQILVVRVPKAPLMFLVLMNLLLAVLGVVLAALAWNSVRHGDTGEIQARLSIPAIVASHFESASVRGPLKNVENTFEGSHGKLGPRIGFRKNAEGAWVFDTWSKA